MSRSRFFCLLRGLGRRNVILLHLLLSCCWLRSRSLRLMIWSFTRTMMSSTTAPFGVIACRHRQRGRLAAVLGRATERALVTGRLRGHHAGHDQQAKPAHRCNLRNSKSHRHSYLLINANNRSKSAQPTCAHAGLSILDSQHHRTVSVSHSNRPNTYPANPASIATKQPSGSPAGVYSVQSRMVLWRASVAPSVRIF